MNIHRLISPAEPAFTPLLRIYTQAHPASERKSIQALEHMLENPNYIFLASSEHDTVTGFAIAVALPTTDAALLEYMAVDAQYRGQGTGAHLFRAIADHAQIQNRYLLVEVDSDRPPTPDAEDQARRKRFYRRLGCKQIEGLTYRMPRVSTAEPPPMDMLIHHPSLPETIEKPRLRTWLEACYTHVYQQPLPDHRIDTMLYGLPERIRLA